MPAARIEGETGSRPRSRLACPSCGHVPAVREEAEQQRADLTVAWLQVDSAGHVATAHHCASCAPAGSVADFACASCGDGPLLTGPDTRAGQAPELPGAVGTWLRDHGWRLDGLTRICPTCTR